MITAKIVDLNESEKKISLSMKALEPANDEKAQPAQKAWKKLQKRIQQNRQKVEHNRR